MDNGIKRHVLNRLLTGVYVLTARDGRQFGAATVTWAMQMSFRPVLIAVSLDRESNICRCVLGSRAAALHVVGARQFRLARRFACPVEAADGTINGEPWVAGATTAPVLPAFPAHFDCAVDQVVDTAGGYALMILRAVAVERRESFAPMTIAALRAHLDAMPVPPRQRPAADLPQPGPTLLSPADGGRLVAD